MVISEPQWGNLHHWALHLGGYDYIYQVIGEAMNFVAEQSEDMHPEESEQWIESIPVAKINEVDISALRDILNNLEVHNIILGSRCALQDC